MVKGRSNDKEKQVRSLFNREKSGKFVQKIPTTGNFHGS
jgi:hypothetical protein